MSDKFVPEEEIKTAFYDKFSREWLDNLNQKSTAEHNLVEILWVGFARGYIAGKNNPSE